MWKTIIEVQNNDAYIKIFDVPKRLLGKCKYEVEIISENIDKESLKKERNRLIQRIDEINKILN